MSLKALTWAFDQNLPPNEKVVLLSIADYADDRGYAFPGMETIARKASMHERTVIRLVAKLEERGLLSRERRHLQNGNRTSDGYQLQTNQVTDHHLTNQVDKVTTVSSTGNRQIEPPVNNNTRASQWPQDLTWNQGHKDKALGKGVNVEVEFEKFRDYHLARASKFVDWSRAFHTWLNNSRPEPRGGQLAGNPHPAPKTPTDRMNEVLAIQDPRETGLTS